MDGVDLGRAYDLGMIKAEKNRPTTTPERRKQLEETEYRITHQLKDDRVNRMRDDLAKATRAGDKQKIEKITNDMRRIYGE